MHSFEVSFGYESVDRTTFSTWIENVLRSTPSYSNETPKERIQFLNKVCQWLATDRWFYPVSSTNKTHRHDITEILLKVPLNTIHQAHTHIHINGLKPVDNQSYRMLVSQRTLWYCTNKKIRYIYMYLTDCLLLNQ